MPESKHATPSAHEIEIKSDLAKSDAHVNQPEEYDELPELTDEWVAGSDHRVGDRLVLRSPGRPKLDSPKKQVTIRLDAEVLDGLRATGPGWQSRINEALKDWLLTRAR